LAWAFVREDGVRLAGKNGSISGASEAGSWASISHTREALNSRRESAAITSLHEERGRGEIAKLVTGRSAVPSRGPWHPCPENLELSRAIKVDQLRVTKL